MAADTVATHQVLTWDSPRLTVTKTSAIAVVAWVVVDTVQGMGVVPAVMAQVTAQVTVVIAVDMVVVVHRERQVLICVKYSNLGYTVA